MPSLLSNEEYEQRLTEQNGECAICARPQGARRFAVDHDHKTGAIRGLLCYGCNAGIGMLQDSPDILRCAALYLERQQFEHDLPAIMRVVDDPLAKRRQERLAWWQSKAKA